MRFIRKGGRIIPIRDTAQKNLKATVTGAQVGALAGILSAAEPAGIASRYVPGTVMKKAFRYSLMGAGIGGLSTVAIRALQKHNKRK